MAWTVERTGIFHASSVCSLCYSRPTLPPLCAHCVGNRRGTCKATTVRTACTILACTSRVSISWREESPTTHSPHSLRPRLRSVEHALCERGAPQRPQVHTSHARCTVQGCLPALQAPLTRQNCAKRDTPHSEPNSKPQRTRAKGTTKQPTFTPSHTQTTAFPQHPHVRGQQPYGVSGSQTHINTHMVVPPCKCHVPPPRRHGGESKGGGGVGPLRGSSRTTRPCCGLGG